MSKFPIPLGDLRDPAQLRRVDQAVAQEMCCPDGCKAGGIGCEAERFLVRARHKWQADLAAMFIASGLTPED